MKLTLHRPCGGMFRLLAVLAVGLAWPAGEVSGARPVESQPAISASQLEEPSLYLVGQIGGEAQAVAVDAQGYVYAGFGPRMHILDARSGAEFTSIGASPVFTDTVSGVAVEGQFAYVVEGDSNRTDAVWLGGRLHILDITNRSFPIVVSTYPLPGKPNAILVAGDYAYVAETDYPSGPNWVGGGLRVVNVADPYHPAEAGFFDSPGYPYGLVYADQRIYLADGATGLRVLEVGSPPAITETGFYDTSGTARGVAVAGGYAYVADGYDGLQVLSLAQGGNPQYLTNVPTNEALAVKLMGNIAVLADGSYGGVVTVDVSVPSLAQQLDSYNTPGKALQVAVSGELAYVADQTGLRRVTLHNPQDLAEVGSYLLPHSARSVRVVGNYAYLVDTRNDFYIFDLSNPSRPQRVGYLDGEGWAYGLAISGGYAYVAEGSALYTLNVGTPQSPTLANVTSSTDTPGGALGVAVANGYAYVAGGLADFRVFSLADPAQPAYVNKLEINGAVEGVALGGSYAYLGAGYGGFFIADLSSPAAPAQAGHWEYTYPTQSYLREVDVWSYYAYVVDTYAHVIRILNVGTVSNPQWSADYFLYGPTGIDMQYDLAYLSSEDGVQVAQPGSGGMLTEKDRYDLPGGAMDVQVAGSYIYAAGQGLWVLWYGIPASTTISPGGGTLISPSDATNYTFPAGAFAEDVEVTHTPLLQMEAPAAPVGLQSCGHWYELDANFSASGLPAQLLPGEKYTVTIQYNEAQLVGAREETLGLYYWDGSRWQLEPSSQVDPSTDTLTASPDHFSTWAVFSQQELLFLPLVPR